MRLLPLLLFGWLYFQSPAASVFSGTWVAEFKGATFVRLDLKSTGTAIAGALGTGDLSVDKNGDVMQVTPIPSTLTPLYEVVVKGSTLMFKRAEGSDAEQFRLTVLGADQAELLFLPDADMLEEIKEAGIPVPKPIRLHKIR